MPQKAGVYTFRNNRNQILYVGKAKNLKNRVSSYFLNNSLLGEKTKQLVSQIEKIEVTIVESELEALLLEAFYIKKHRPKYNIRLSDDKSYVQIKINIKDKYPAVLLSRRIDDKKSLYFGPYPNSGAVKLVLRTIRRAFPYVSVRNHPKRVCLYNHIGLCPCPAVFDSVDLQKHYRKNIRSIIRILEGQAGKIVKELERERDKASKSEDYEKAKELQQKISALQIITEPFHQPFEYDVNPNLRSDIRQQELKELMEILNVSGLKLDRLRRIECYDISNTQGVYATGSLVVLTHGEIDKSQYRRFKIKKSGTPNDFAMMEEVLTRRFRREGWEMPDLVIVDGGKGQITSAIKALVANGVSIPLIGLAKREETIIIPQGESVKRKGESKNSSRLNLNPSPFKEVSLPKNTKALHLIMRIRDEAHRFAITYHRKLRSKASLL